jgi:hypothetical protein
VEERKVNVLSIGNICNGALPEIFNRDLEKILENINDPDTDADKKRSMTIELTFIPFSDRSGASVELKTKMKLVGVPAVTATVFIGKHEGRLVAVPKDEHQKELFGEQEAPEQGNVVGMKSKEKAN